MQNGQVREQAEVMDPIYDNIGISYSGTRRTDPRIARLIWNELRDAERILNIGAGAGSYEPEDVDLVAVEPSVEMIAQRPEGAHPAVKAFAEALPFKNNEFTLTMTVLSMHHWTDKPRAFREINRVTRDRFIAVSWNPEASTFWLTRDYFPEILEEDVDIFPKVGELMDHFDEVEISPIPIPEDCIDGFLSAFWKRPQAYLDPNVRQAISSFAKMKDADTGLAKLKADLESGLWVERNQDILDRSELDVGYYIMSAKIKKA